MRGYSIRKRTYTDKKTGGEKKTSTYTVFYDLRAKSGEPRKQKTKGGFRTKKEADAWGTAKAEEIRHGVVTDDRITVEQWLRQWLELISDKAPSTLHAYRNHVERHIVPALGEIRLAELHWEQIEDAKEQWAKTDLGRRKGKVGKLSARTQAHIFHTLRDALNHAKEKKKIIASNPCDLVDAPKFERKEMKVLDEAESAALLKALESHEIGAAITVSLGAGLRRGELLGLKWGDVDLDKGTLTVRRSLDRDGGITREKDPKTRESQATISLADFVVERLHRHRIEQAQRFPDNVAVLQTPETLVFERNGQPWVPNTFTTAFMRALDDAGFRHVRLHDLRHTFATLLLESGVDVKTISKMLRHADIATTLRTYAKATDKLMSEAAGKLDNAITAAMRKAPRVS